MCIPTFVKFYLLTTLFITMIFIDINPEYSILKVWLLIALAVLSVLVRCPKCKKSLGLSESKMTTLPGYKCSKCGQNLMKCEIENDNK